MRLADILLLLTVIPLVALRPNPPGAHLSQDPKGSIALHEVAHNQESVDEVLNLLFPTAERSGDADWRKELQVDPSSKIHHLAAEGRWDIWFSSRGQRVQIRLYHFQKKVKGQGSERATQYQQRLVWKGLIEMADDESLEGSIVPVLGSATKEVTAAFWSKHGKESTLLLAAGAKQMFVVYRNISADSPVVRQTWMERKLSSGLQKHCDALMQIVGGPYINDPDYDFSAGWL
jgi:hypothetical protein